MRDAAAYARRVRRKVSLSQVAFARRIGVPVDTVRNWEQGKRTPQGPAGRCCASSTMPPKRRFRLSTGIDQLWMPASGTPDYPAASGWRTLVPRIRRTGVTGTDKPAPFDSSRRPVPPSATLSNQG
jgi:Helix-turn-helix domain